MVCKISQKSLLIRMAETELIRIYVDGGTAPSL